jgi:dihydrofolate synthase/folylpolyglutamate synthase
MPHERYFEAVDYLQRRLWHDLPIVPVERALQSRIRQLLAHFGDPQRTFPLIHVGGSAGKGSTSTIAASILQTAGLKSALYTSPHLQTFIERIRVNDRLMAPDAFADSVLGLEPLVRKMHLDVIDGVGFGRPSLVEVAFATGMKHFADERVDAAVVEVGLGGRTDCTNVFEATPHVSVITNVDYEHRERLGWTLQSIAREKSRIVHGGIAITGAQRREALRVIEERAAGQGASLWRLGREITYRIMSSDAAGSTFEVATPLGSFEMLGLPLAGAHQASNAALAVAATLAHAQMKDATINESHVRDGLARVRLSARLETVQCEPTVLLDSAHNPLEARRLAEALRAHWLDEPARRLTLVVGILADKDQASMVRALSGVAHRAIVTQPPLGERTGDPERMLRLFRSALGGTNVAFEPVPERALELALDDSRQEDVICVTGSMFLVGALRERWVPERQILERRSSDIA